MNLGKLACFWTILLFSSPSSSSYSSHIPYSPWNETYQLIVLKGGIVFGVPDAIRVSSMKHVFEPQNKDVLITGGKVLALLEPSSTDAFVESMQRLHLSILRIDVPGELIIPGLIDVHVHADGGGGEQGSFDWSPPQGNTFIPISGPSSRTPESHLSQLINAGLTTIVGILGTDGIGRRSVTIGHCTARQCFPFV